MKAIVLILSLFAAFAWILWYGVQGRGEEVIAPNWQWIVLVIAITNGLYIATDRTVKTIKAATKRKKQRLIAAGEAEEQQLIAIREEELRLFLKSRQRLWQCINCENAMTDGQRMKYGVCPTCKGDTWVKTHTDQQILDFINVEFSISEPLPSDIDIKDIETRLARYIKEAKEARKARSLRRQKDLLEEQKDLLSDQNEEIRKLRMVEEEKRAIEEEQLRELRERDRHD